MIIRVSVVGIRSVDRAQFSRSLRACESERSTSDAGPTDTPRTWPQASTDHCACRPRTQLAHVTRQEDKSAK